MSVSIWMYRYAEQECPGCGGKFDRLFNVITHKTAGTPLCETCLREVGEMIEPALEVSARREPFGDGLTGEALLTSFS